MKSSLARSSSIEFMLPRWSALRWYQARQKGSSESHLKEVSSLKLPPPSSSSETFLLGALEVGLEFGLEFTAEVVRDDCLD